MAVASPSSLETLDPKSEKSDPSSENPNPNPDPTPSQSVNPNPNTNPPIPNPNPNPNLVTPPPPSFAPSFRPLGAPTMPQYSTISFGQNPSPSIQPPGVSGTISYTIQGSATGAPPMRYPPPYAPPMAYGQAPNGYMAVPPHALSW